MVEPSLAQECGIDSFLAVRRTSGDAPKSYGIVRVTGSEKKKPLGQSVGTVLFENGAAVEMA